MTSPLCSAREALEPFAEAAAHLHPSHPDDGLTLDCIPVRAWRKAAEVYAALASSPPAETEEGELRNRLSWALDRLDECGKQVEFTLGMCRSLADCRDYLAALSRGEAAATCKQSLQVHPEAGAPSREAIRAQLIAILDPIAHSLPDFRQGNINNGADQILSLFSPQSLKASEREGVKLDEMETSDLREVIETQLEEARLVNPRGHVPIDITPKEAEYLIAILSEHSAAEKDQERRAVPLSAISEGWRLDAERWRALMRCGRIKMQGSAGVDPETGERRNGSNVHFGAEFWPEQLPDDYRAKHPEEAARYDRSTRWGVACLTALADAIIEQSAAPALSEGDKA